MSESMSNTGNEAWSLLDGRCVKAANMLGKLLGVKDFWFRLIRIKIGTFRIEAEAARRVEEQRQRSTVLRSQSGRNENLVEELLKASLKLINKSITAERTNLEKLLEEHLDEKGIVVNTREWRKAKSQAKEKVMEAKKVSSVVCLVVKGKLKRVREKQRNQREKQGNLKHQKNLRNLRNLRENLENLVENKFL